MKHVASSYSETFYSQSSIMLHHRHNVILLFFGCSFAYLSGVQAQLSCNHGFSYPRFYTFNQSCCEPAPAEITQDAGVSYLKRNEEIPTINVTVTKVRENFNLTLLAIPMENDACPPRIDETFDLRQYFETCVVFREGDKKHVKIFDYIFSGCYYVLMTNATGASWQSEPKFYKTSYVHRNTKIEHNQPQITPKHGDKRMTVETTLGIPMRCIRVMARIYELNGALVNEDNNTIKDEILNTKIPWSQQCFLTPDGPLGPDPCTSSKTTTKLTFIVKNLTAIVVTWANLSLDGSVYYLRFHGFPLNCYGKRNINYEHITRWRPIVEDILIPIGFQNGTVEVPDESDPDLFYLMVLLCGMLGASIIAVLAYFIAEYYRVQRPLDEEENMKEFLETKPMIHINYSKPILLVYAKGSPEFMKTMSNLRYRLRQKCNCEVHDVYSPKDFETVAKLGAHGWVKKLLMDGSKVVWVDTPQLRCRFDGNKKKDTWSDFRDAAIPFAVSLVTNLFQNPNTQYLEHFVVRVEGFEVEGVCDADPLRVISPHTRYRVPVHFARLCGDLTKVQESPEDIRNAV